MLPTQDEFIERAKSALQARYDNDAVVSEADFISGVLTALQALRQNQEGDGWHPLAPQFWVIAAMTGRSILTNNPVPNHNLMVTEDSYQKEAWMTGNTEDLVDDFWTEIELPTKRAQESVRNALCDIEVLHVPASEFWDRYYE